MDTHPTPPTAEPPIAAQRWTERLLRDAEAHVEAIAPSSRRVWMRMRSTLWERIGERARAETRRRGYRVTRSDMIHEAIEAYLAERQR